MLTLIQHGGIVAMLMILLTGLVGLGTAFHFALRAQRKSLGFIKGMAYATLFAVLAATCSDLRATLNAFNEYLEKKPGDFGTATRIVLEGFAESMSPGILGFALLALIGLLTAVGMRRLDEREASRA